MHSYMKNWACLYQKRWFGEMTPKWGRYKLPVLDFEVSVLLPFLKDLKTFLPKNLTQVGESMGVGNQKFKIRLNFKYIFAPPKAPQEFFSRNILKMPNLAILGHFNKWPNLDFRKSIRDPIHGHYPFKSSPDMEELVKLSISETLDQLFEELGNFIWWIALV